MTLAAPADRGSLTIAPKVVEKIARAAVLEVDGTMAVSGKWSHWVGRSLPDVDVDLGGHRASLDITIAAQWPTPLAPLVSDVQRQVRAQVEALAAVTVDRADIHVDHVGVPAVSQRRVS